MKTIPLSRGYVATVDDEDYDRVAQFKWNLQTGRRGRLSASRTDYSHGQRRTIMMHQFVIGFPGMAVRHKDDNGLNNCRHNLLPAPADKHGGGRRKLKPKTSQFKGVYFFHRSGVWRAIIAGTYLGQFETEEKAARAYDAMALEKFGQFARLNFNTPTP